MTIKIYECRICKKLYDKRLKGCERFRGTRKDVRKHIVEVHNIKGRKNIFRANKKDFGQSNITKECLSEELK